MAEFKQQLISVAFPKKLMNGHNKINKGTKSKEVVGRNVNFVLLVI